jgi:hypothetical protein
MFLSYKYSLFQDYKLINMTKDVIDGKSKKCDINMMITNEDRTFGATLSYFISWYVVTSRNEIVNK